MAHVNRTSTSLPSGGFFDRRTAVQVAAAVIGIAAVLGGAAKWTFTAGASPPVPAGLLALTAFGAVVWLRRGGATAPAAWLVIVMLTLFVGVSGYMNGGLGSTAPLLGPVVPVIAVILVGAGGAWGALLVVGAMTAGLAVAGQAGLLPEAPPAADVTRGIALVACGVVATWVTWGYARATHELLRSNWEQANHDHLTGLRNRRNIDALLASEAARARRAGSALSVVMIDVDHFKRFNDSYGHQVGDVCLMAVARALEGCMRRPADAAGRFGGEEFIVVLPDTDNPGGAVLAETIRKAIAELPPLSVDARPVTATLGVATAVGSDIDSAEALVAAADEALYRGKSAGRNRVVAVTCRPAQSTLTDASAA